MKRVRSKEEFGLELAGLIPKGSRYAIARDAGVNPDSVARWAQGQNEPGALELAKLALVLDRSVDSLLYDIGPQPLSEILSEEAVGFTPEHRAILSQALRALLKLVAIDQPQSADGNFDLVRTFCSIPIDTLRAVEAARRRGKKWG
jgi:transcriptional regulator with XRE-family HTH domain